MESPSHKVRVFLGEYEVVETRPDNSITVHLGKNVTITMHTALAHSIKRGDRLPLFTEIPHALAIRTPIQ